ncbi:MAG: polysaccharide lyase family 1 protein [Bryobacteraceae bacterium]
MLKTLLCVLASGAAAFAANGLKGFGADTKAGRGGKIIRVTTLDAAGPGSLRAALETAGPRIVVFEVGGVIDLDRKNLSISEPFLTVAGETAPSPGVTIIRGGMSIRTHDVVIRHIRFRPGDCGLPKKSGWEPEVTTSSAYNVVVDHCSMSWAVDENLSASGPRYSGPQATSHDLTFSNCILAEGLYNSTHAKGIHSMGTLIHDACTNIAIIGNLYAHNNQRNPYFKALTTGVVVNNVIYNPGTRAITVDFPVSEWEGRPAPANGRVAIVGNVMFRGANTRAGLEMIGRKGDVYLKDNLAPDSPLTAGAMNLLDKPPVWPAGLVAAPAAEAVKLVMARAGARPKDRDEVDLRILRDFEQRKGKFIDSQDEVGGYPKPKPTRRKLEIPKDVDAWLAKMAAAVE